MLDCAFLLGPRSESSNPTGCIAYDYAGLCLPGGSGSLRKRRCDDAWVQRYTGLGIGASSASAVVVDKSGNVVVTGSAYNGHKKDYYTAKYAATSGALLWEQRYHGPNINWDDSATALAVDPDGNVIVTGGSAAAGLENGKYNMYTAKYAAADGALLWEERYNGPAKLSDWGQAVAVDNIERAPAAIGPWSTIATPTAPLDGLIEYVDSNPPVGTAFYRTSTQ